MCIRDSLGPYEGEDLVIGIGKFGPYVRHGKSFASLARTDDPYTIGYDRAAAVSYTHLLRMSRIRRGRFCAGGSRRRCGSAAMKSAHSCPGTAASTDGVINCMR